MLFLTIYNTKHFQIFMQNNEGMISVIFERARQRFPNILSDHEQVSVITNIFQWRNSHCFPIILECVRFVGLDIDRLHKLYLDLVFTLGSDNYLGGFAIFDVLHFLEEALKNKGKKSALISKKKDLRDH